MIGVFVALDLFLFYIFWEIVLVPMYLIIGIWGGANRIYSTIKFVLYTLVGSLLKDGEGQLTMQAQTQGGGAVDLLVCDYRGGEVRGYVRHDGERLGELGANPSLRALFGENGYLAITFDLASTGQRYQGIVPLEGSSLAEACESYFAQSEQVPTLIRVAVKTDGQGCVAGGLLVLAAGGPVQAGGRTPFSRLGGQVSNTAGQMRQILRESDLVSLMSESMLSGDASEGLAVLPLAQARVSRAVGITWLKRAPLQPLAARFVELLVASAGGKA